jgi:hypothetical protein
MAVRLRASLSRNVAEYDTAVYSYNQSLQSAFKDVAEQVQSLQKLNEQRKIAESRGNPRISSNWQRCVSAPVLALPCPSCKRKSMKLAKRKT